MATDTARAWDPHAYRAHSSMQVALGGDFLDRLAFRGDERVLDVGCGDGRMTERVRARVPAGSVVGLDRSAAMVDEARRTHPAGAFREGDVADLDEDAAFDVVVSFTALHWVVERHGATLAALRRALVPGGRLCATLPGAGNCALLVETALAVQRRAPYAPHTDGFAFPWLFATRERYAALLDGAGLAIDRLELLPKDVVHADADALRGWVRTTWMPWTDVLPRPLREPFIADVVEAYAGRLPPDADGRLHVPSFRLEVEAHRPA